MVRRLVSLAMEVFLINIYIRSQLSPHDPLFVFVSGNMALNIGLIMMGYVVTAVSFSRRFKSWAAWAACSVLAGLLLGVGFFGLFPGLLGNYWLTNNLLPMDSMMVVEGGVILALCALTYGHAARPAWTKQLNWQFLIKKLAIPAPKTFHSPNWLASWVSHSPLSRPH